ncbi:MAG: tRNA pseudouridine(55) synthase TruB [Pseudomonadota bacterium]
MARRKKGNPVNGWIIVDKPAGMTSTAVVNKLRWGLNARKAGHAGTLDPEATGLLAIAFGEATKVIPYVTDALKAYAFDVRWGEATNTDDAQGEVIATSPARPTPEAIRDALATFTGDIQQVPPRFSAVRVEGERAYAKAREDEDFELAARPLFVESLTMAAHDTDGATLEMVCGKGGYVRSIARDLGEVLGCHGHVLKLRRLWSGPFEEGAMVPWDTLLAAMETDTLSQHLIPLEAGLTDVPEVRCSLEAAARLRHGNPAPVLWSNAGYGEDAWVSQGGRAIALGTAFGGEFRPSRVIVDDAQGSAQ